MFEEIFSHISKKIDLTEQEKEIVKTFFTYRKIRKKQYLLQGGDVCSHLSFVKNGLFRSYYVDEKGTEHMNLFAWSGWWTSDLYSFLTGEKSLFDIDALEDSEVLMITLAQFEEMTLQVPKMDRYFRMVYQHSLAVKDRRLFSFNVHTAQEKYMELLESSPEIFQKIPQNLIASYLGIAPETLSRIKKNISLR